MIADLRPKPKPATHPETPAGQACENCQFSAFEAAMRQHFCRKNPPQFVGISPPTPAEPQGGPRFMNPPVFPTGWCGQWRQKPPAAMTDGTRGPLTGERVDPMPVGPDEVYGTPSDPNKLRLPPKTDET